MKKVVSFLGLIGLFLGVNAQSFFSEEIIVDDTAMHVNHLRFIDINNNSMQDILWYSSDKLAWMENVGEGVFQNEHPLYEERDLRSSLFYDLEGDQDLDILDYTNYQLSSFENDGEGNFSLQCQIDSGYIRLLSILDVNGDDKLDIVCLKDLQISWYENLGNLTYGNLEVLNQDYFSVYKLIDVDNDGDMDIVSEYNFADEFQLYWLETDEDGMFNKTHFITESNTFIYYFHVKDMDNDDFPDIIYTIGGHGIYWNKNNGDGSFMDAAPLFSKVTNYQKEIIKDFDNDGDFDILSAQKSSNIDDILICWNNGSGSFEETEYIDQSNESPYWLYSLDIDNDGDEDVITLDFNTNSLYWYKNNSGSFSPKEKLIELREEATPSFININFIDIDNDEDKDFFITYSNLNLISYYKNESANFIANNNNKATALLFPNPSTGKVKIETKNVSKIEIFTINGKLIRNYDSYVKKIEFNLSQEPKGVYFIKLSSKNDVISKKLILK